MDYYKLTERLLYNYKSLKTSVRNMKQQIDLLDYGNLSSINYNQESSSRTYAVHSPTEEEALHKLEKKNFLEMQIKKTSGKLEQLERAFKVLNPTEMEIIQDKYLEGKLWWQIAYKVKFNERWCREIRKRAIKKISIALYGERALGKKKEIS